MTTYYKLPIYTIPFFEIPSLEKMNYQYIYCSVLPLIEYMKLDLNLVTVYDAFDNDIESIEELQNKDFLFGRVVADKFNKRGEFKCVQIGSLKENISREDLPDLKYSSNNNPSESNWFYMKEGEYVIFKGIKSELSKVKHLEGIALYSENIIRLRVVIELLKKNVKEGLIKLSDIDYKNIAYKVLRTDPSLLKTKDNLIKDGVNNWIPSMLLTPLYMEIAKEDRERVKNYG